MSNQVRVRLWLNQLLPHPLDTIIHSNTYTLHYFYRYSTAFVHSKQFVSERTKYKKVGIISLDPEQYQEIAQKDLKHVIPRSFIIVHTHKRSHTRTLSPTSNTLYYSCYQNSLSTHFLNPISQPTLLDISRCWFPPNDGTTRRPEMAAIFDSNPPSCGPTLGCKSRQCVGLISARSWKD